jgi:predicted DNA binding CopG/RHH family protein
MKNDTSLDKEELELLKDLESKAFIEVPLSEEQKQEYSSYAKYTKSLQEKRQTTIRFSISDLATVKAKAKEIGIGYQNLIQALVHNYAQGKIKLEL